MKQAHEITNILEHLQATEGDTLSIEKEAILAEYQKLNANKSGIAIKVLTILGGFLATLTFIAFLVVAGLYNSEMGLAITGFIFIAGAVGISKAYDILIFDAIAVTAFATGLFILSYGLEGVGVNEKIVCIILIIIAIATLAIVQNYILAFLAVLTVNGSVIALIWLNNNYGLLHIYIAVIVIVLTLFMLDEAGLITGGKKIARLYNPIRLGLIINLLAAYVIVSSRSLLLFSIHFNLVSSVTAVIGILYILPRIVKLLNIQHTGSKAGIYIATALVLLPTLYAPAIPGALLITVLCFWVNYKTGLVIGIIALIYFITRYYYDLQFTLLTKSILLFSSGILFILFYLLTHKKLEQK